MKVGYDVVIRVIIDRDAVPLRRPQVLTQVQQFFATPGLLPANTEVEVLQVGKVTLEDDLPVG
jgi:hypothetical protein